MTRRLAWAQLEPAAYQAMLELEKFSADRIDPILFELIKMRASYLNGCAYCLDKHTHDALALGESTQRLVVVSAWREAPHLFTERERAALALTDAVTRLGEHGVPDDVWAQAAEQFEEKELVHLLMAIATINAWNRIAISTRAETAPRG
ncbi:carboxymuconolactone decarboxylase family protein [Kitasatospora kifunensis]|uniref:AhpD family alkylhydroperoxidase n=1 Tax=Kitasatospora kifunensis TaxID=58351 RepID=A0A7W7QXB3_KITKI|nr:carboxymuconolactone decarboxylase family protein [Kitasatospora kifunensis]MBB4921263.1 AhpD family alkylhydroperoxidase [Kitasatospora kifunensis]